MKTIIKKIGIGVFLVSLTLLFAACGRSQLEGRWEYDNSNGYTEYFEFSNGTVTTGTIGGSKVTATYTISDETLRMVYPDTRGNEQVANFNIITVQEMEQIDSSEAYKYIAFDNSSLYFGDKEKVYKRK